MTARCAIPIARPVAVPAPLFTNHLGRLYLLACSRSAAAKDRQKVRLA
jgi:hypothetical protein